MDEFRQQAINFLEKEIKTYLALSVFLSKRGVTKDVRVGTKKVLIVRRFTKSE